MSAAKKGGAVKAGQPITLDVDLGNSAVKYRGGGARGRSAYGIAHSVELPPIERVGRVRVSSVLTPKRDAEFAELVRARWGCECEFARSSGRAAGLTNGYLKPETLGVDRWLAAIAGYHHAQGAVLVVDFGTAVTLDYVDEHGAHRGGYIVPGTALMCRSLQNETASIRYDSPSLLDDLTPGRQTRDAVERGATLALVHLVEGELERFRALGHDNARLILCGGGADSVAVHLRCAYEVIPDLVLDGLALALP